MELRPKTIACKHNFAMQKTLDGTHLASLHMFQNRYFCDYRQKMSWKTASSVGFLLVDDKFFKSYQKCLLYLGFMEIEI